MKKILSLAIAGLFSLNISANPECTTPIDANSFQTELTKIKGHDFDEAKKSACEKLLEGKCFSTDQIKQLAENLSFEDDKLDFIKKAYAHVTDKANFVQLKSIFEFDDSKNEIDKLMQ